MPLSGYETHKMVAKYDQFLNFQRLSAFLGIKWNREWSLL